MSSKSSAFSAATFLNTYQKTGVGKRYSIPPCLAISASGSNPGSKTFWCVMCGLFYWLECTPIVSDVQCRLERRESGYCARAAPEDVTAQATWTASDPTVAAVTTPGRFTPLADGLLEIHARSGFQSASPE